MTLPASPLSFLSLSIHPGCSASPTHLPCPSASVPDVLPALPQAIAWVTAWPLLPPEWLPRFSDPFLLHRIHGNLQVHACHTLPTAITLCRPSPLTHAQSPMAPHMGSSSMPVFSSQTPGHGLLLSFFLVPQSGPQSAGCFCGESLPGHHQCLPDSVCPCPAQYHTEHSVEA